jgi:hypothetical protein
MIRFRRGNTIETGCHYAENAAHYRQINFELQIGNMA